jgi:hypothetical protein
MAEEKCGAKRRTLDAARSEGDNRRAGHEAGAERRTRLLTASLPTSDLTR